MRIWASAFGLVLVAPGALAAPIHDAIQKNDTQEVRRLLSQGVDLRAEDRDEFGDPALHVAPSRRRPGGAEVAGLLLDRGADLNARSELGATPLHRAAYGADPDLVRLLSQADHR